MRHIIRKLAAIGAMALSALCAPLASAAVLNFDDIVGPDEFAAVPGNYDGLDWSNAGLNVFTGELPFAPHSGHGQVTTGWTDGGPVESTIRFLAPTIFHGAWFSGYEDGSVRFDLYAGGQLVARSGALQLSGTSTFLDAGWAGAIDAVVVFASAEGAYGMDDFTFADPAQVPEPGTLALILAGAGCLILRRKQQGPRP